MVRIRFMDPDSEAPRTVKLGFRADESQASVASSRASSYAEPRAHWYRSHGWSTDPFVAWPMTSEDLVGFSLETETIKAWLLRKSPFGTIRGPAGIGKTLLLKWTAAYIERTLAQTHVVIDCTSATDEDSLVSVLTKPYSSFFRGYSGETPEDLVQFLQEREPKHLVLLFDNCEALGEREAYLTLLMQHAHASVILAGTNPPILVMDSLKLVPRPLSTGEATTLLQARLAHAGAKDHAPFTPREITKLWHAAGQHVPNFLAACRAFASGTTASGTTASGTAASGATAGGATADAAKTSQEATVASASKEEESSAGAMAETKHESASELLEETVEAAAQDTEQAHDALVASLAGEAPQARSVKVAPKAAVAAATPPQKPTHATIAPRRAGKAPAKKAGAKKGSTSKRKK